MVAGKRMPSCHSCYNRHLNGGPFRRSSHKKELLLARDLMRKGWTTQRAARHVGMRPATMLARLGRLAALESL